MSKHVLFVDDESDLRNIVGDALVDCGYHVTAAADAREAMEALRSGTLFSHVVSDISMPGGISGLELATFALEAQPEARIIVASGYQRSQLPPIPGKVRFLAKPYRLRQLLAMLEA
jgi:CheY-like chemotaxis protein